MKAMNKLFITLILLYLIWRWLNQPPKTQTAEYPQRRQKPVYPLEGRRLTAVPKEEDDLTKIKGIGLKASNALQRGGIHTFDQLAALDADHIKTILAGYGLRNLDPTTWSAQAASAGKSE